MYSATYHFSYRSPSGRPRRRSVVAEYEQDAFKLIAKFLKARPGRTLIPNMMRVTASYRIEDPPNIMIFLNHMTMQEGRDMITRASKSRFKIPEALKHR